LQEAKKAETERTYAGNRKKTFRDFRALARDRPIRFFAFATAAIWFIEVLASACHIACVFAEHFSCCLRGFFIGENHFFQVDGQ
jgi:hypothetical protein